MKNCLFFIFLVLSSKVNAQVDINKLSPVDYEQLKKSTTYFILPDFEADKKQAYIDMLKDVWFFSKLKVVTTEESQEINLLDLSVSCIIFKAITFENMLDRYTFDLNIAKSSKGKTGELMLSSIASIVFTKKRDVNFLMPPSRANEDSRVFRKNFMNNFSLGFIKNYMQYLNFALYKNEGKHEIYMKLFNKEECRKLANDTLYMPDYIPTYSRKDINKVLKKAKFNYKFISTIELDNKILNSKNDFYYLSFITNSSYKTLTIIKSNEGLFIYNCFTIGKYNNGWLTSDDVKGIGKALKK